MEMRRANSELFWIQPHARPPASGFLKYILIGEKWIFNDKKDVNGEVAGQTTIKISSFHSPPPKYEY